MTQNNSIAKLAEQMRMTPQKLLEQLNAAGMRFDSADQTITSAEKAKLLSHLRAAHGGSEAKERRPISLKSGAGTTGTVKTGAGRTGGAPVEVRVKRKIELPASSCLL